MTRVIGKFGSDGRIGELVAALKEAGFPRQDMIISNATEPVVDLGDVNFLQTETEQLGGTDTYAQSIDMQLARGQTLVAVETSKHRRDELVDAMRRFGARQVKVD